MGASETNRLVCAAVLLGAVLSGCGGDGEAAATDGNGGGSAAGGSSAGGGGASNGGAPGGGATSNGGSAGAPSNGGRTSNGGASNGGASNGGASNGGASNGGASNGGASNGGTSNGGASNGGASNGGTSNGGTSNGGASNGGTTSSGGTSASGGASSGGSGGSAGSPVNCKKGIAANTAPGAAFFPAITWWYNWSMAKGGADVGIEFVPMIWGTGSLSAAVPAGSKFLLTFNEPNFKSQSNLTAQEAASHWPEIEAKASAAGVPIVGPGLNFCGPAQNCNGTSPYQYYKDFFAACTGCKVDYIAVHWYNCDLPSLKGYIDGNGSLEGFVQFGKPIWLTEFSCNGSASVAQQEAYMRAAVPYLEANPNVFRYSWFSAGPIPNAQLINSDGTPTALGNVYMGLAESCR